MWYPIFRARIADTAAAKAAHVHPRQHPQKRLTTHCSRNLRRIRLPLHRHPRDHLGALEIKGYLRKLPGKSRGLVPSNWSKLLRAEFLLPIPILGRVPAGGPLLAEENIEGSLDLSEEFAGKKTFALKVHGDSMIEAGICEDDLVVVRSQDEAEPGEIVVALVDGEATVKRLERRNGKLWLQPANPRYEPIPVAGDTRVIGKVIGVIRSYERKY